MPCYQPPALPSGVTTTGRTSYATKADCFAACKEGACCEGKTCVVRRQCQCYGPSMTFKGVGTVCTPNPCVKTTCSGFDLCGWCPSPCPQEIQVRLSNCQDTDYGSGFESMNGTYSLALQPVLPGSTYRSYGVSLSGARHVYLSFWCIGNATGYYMSCTAVPNFDVDCLAFGVVHPFTSCCVSESFASNNGTGFSVNFFNRPRNLAALSFTAEVMC